jgi:hypothetical protein
MFRLQNWEGGLLRILFVRGIISSVAREICGSESNGFVLESTEPDQPWICCSSHSQRHAFYGESNSHISRNLQGYGSQSFNIHTQAKWQRAFKKPLLFQSHMPTAVCK